MYWAVLLLILPSTKLEVWSVSRLIEEVLIVFKELVIVFVLEGEECTVVCLLVDEHADIAFA